jgi:excinuclease ABC subunit A
MKTNTLTAQYLNGSVCCVDNATYRTEQRKDNATYRTERRKGNGQTIVIHGASGNNLKHIDVSFP